MDCHGKPGLADKASGIEFNVAHSKGQVLIALSRAGGVGVDIEQENATIEALELARGTFHADDLVCMEKAAEAERADLFFRCWTRKEAVAKADGRGLTLPLKGFSVGISSEKCDEFAVEIESPFAGTDEEEKGYSPESAGYFVRDIGAVPGFAAALAVTAPGARVSLHDFQSCCDDLNMGGEVTRHHPVIVSYNG